MKVGERVNILEDYLGNKRYVEYIIIQIIPKKYYNLYLCKSVKYGYKTTFTDLDIGDKVRLKDKIRGVDR